ncbi:4'-phosphopantetheinyl transferase superfamily protein [Amycolatopsis acidiphila]|uniref:4'-phosphopantetheinyl transferase superfamily protein n=1 Tax=Amycolatopsis acidiphila TaxID=715473 RepID=A0A558AK23_9PSEU|nr:4'-phosphopantetheinyl transferase superfamily protein [Amycolatopsis acidiphila]TVT24541.1 4'-phosphopantetheinyl transferase superfamily protein [Amycolatopsis acidiphila]UIJ59247.1 4'-phosphopantetheinyl transferase superfamily protein [Amycolatopsis acidiphila]GHG79320.1 4'-phosphopantetheinyl transferase [Amycolatopsis acidiphila]
MIECLVWWARPLPGEARYLALLDEPERGRFESYRREIDRRRFLTGRVLAKSVLGAQLGRTPEAVRFDATCDDCGKPHGKPKLAGVEFSISHSGERVGLAVTSAPVGLDVETETRRAEDNLIAYTLNETEQAALRGLDPDARTRAFYEYWTRKEALMKATGRGLKIPLQSLTLDGARLAHSADPALNPATTHLADLDPGEGYRGAVAVLTAAEVVVKEGTWEG